MPTFSMVSTARGWGLALVAALLLPAGDATAKPIPPWVPVCEAKIKAALTELAETDPRLLWATVRRQLGIRYDDRMSCRPKRYSDWVGASVELPDFSELFVGVEVGDAILVREPAPVWTEQAHHYAGFPGSDPPIPPKDNSTAWTHLVSGRLAHVSVSDESEATDRFVARMKIVADECIAIAPTSSPPPPPQDDPSWARRRAARQSQEGPGLDERVDAERAVREIESMCGYASERVGLVADLGVTYAALKRILRLGELATPYLVRLAHSKNPVARLAAIDGFSATPSPRATRELRRLSSDRARAPAEIGCDFDDVMVGEMARGALGQ